MAGRIPVIPRDGGGRIPNCREAGEFCNLGGFGKGSSPFSEFLGPIS
jgi:hypothetical protein